MEELGVDAVDSNGGIEHPFSGTAVYVDK